MRVVLQPHKLTLFLLVAPIHFVMGAPEWVPQTRGPYRTLESVTIGRPRLLQRRASLLRGLRARIRRIRSRRSRLKSREALSPAKCHDADLHALSPSPCQRIPVGLGISL